MVSQPDVRASKIMRTETPNSSKFFKLKLKHKQSKKGKTFFLHDETLFLSRRKVTHPILIPQTIIDSLIFGAYEVLIQRKENLSFSTSPLLFFLINWIMIKFSFISSTSPNCDYFASIFVSRAQRFFGYSIPPPFCAECNYPALIIKITMVMLDRKKIVTYLFLLWNRAAFDLVCGTGSFVGVASRCTGKSFHVDMLNV